ncbi:MULTISPECIES: LysE family translocator [unclassified Herbaspirillum]|uniref:LysE family translocator n=1 Tax=unclassified Herbaspirillum TaxID=2624150 RepID=UPI00114EB251|nr:MULTISPECIES: LysE family transporter [unclassified Herbaspirillum]MBB5391516.1 threonine/homoserine/homoserine lactone efflux protein [Herbaspirillum sp. SJZ102]TQK12801.1 threonine/homoserine/homoserine lactone efflux protein [Herbaspirillum sp. SJZ130]TQK14805.1 threonine/homoserine/homoserine lactone efflux protein [Herbaspirillum sp. SJZ106]TWC71056.1 threonine/homoserine/homoserine lactone efflux protein [Herbaspirillum sp. SJZ099]
MDALFFIPVAIMLALVPGPNNFCALNNGIRHGIGAALLATFGRVAAFAIFLTVSAVGLGAMLLASETAFTAVKWVGAVYLFYLGWRAWRSREFQGLELADGMASSTAAGKAGQAHKGVRALAMQEFLLGITNPKAIMLFAAIFPQFINQSRPAAHQFLVLGSIYLGAEFVSSTVYAACGRQIRHFIRTSRGVARLNKATGGFFIGAGALLLAARQ